MTEPLPNQPTSQTPSAPSENYEIDLVQLIHTLWCGRRTLILTTAIFGCLGLFIAIFSPKEYSVSTVMVPQETGKSRMGGLTGLAAMAGFNLNMGSSSDITPPVYPQIVNSVPFQLELMNTPLNFADIDRPVSLYEYFTEHARPSVTSYLFKYTLGLPFVILKAIKGEEKEESVKQKIAENQTITKLTKKQRNVQNALKDLITIEYNNKDGYVVLTCRMPEALPAAQLTQRTQQLLQQYITVFKVEKAKASLEFIQQRYSEVAKQYEKAQKELAAFTDRNRNMATATAQSELVHLNNNYNLIYGVYSELAKQLEQARIQVKEDTPVFTIIRPVSVPLQRSKPNRPLILIVWLFLGGVTGIAITFSRKYLPTMKEQWGKQKLIN